MSNAAHRACAKEHLGMSQLSHYRSLFWHGSVPPTDLVILST